MIPILDTDLWMVNPIAADPAFPAIKQRLKADVICRRRITEDCATSPTGLIRRSTRFTPSR